MATERKTSYLDRYSATSYSPRAKSSDIPFWYQEERARRRVWGSLIVLGVVVYFFANVYIMFTAPETVLLPALPYAGLMAAYLIWLGYKLARHG
jgi:hypothetical protein